MDVVVVPLILVLIQLITLYIWVVVIGVILSWLTVFNVINRSNQFVHMVGSFIYRITEPALGRIRRYVPSFGGVDISPIILILGLWAVQNILGRLAYKIDAGGI